MTTNYSSFRWSFRLRTFLCAITLLSIGICLYTNWTRQRQAARDKLTAANVLWQSDYGHRTASAGRLSLPYAPPPVRRTWSEVLLGDGLHEIFLMQQEVSGDVVRSIAAFPELRWLSLCGTDVGDQELYDLRGLCKLESLNLANCPISDASAAVIGGFREMKGLDLDKTNITDAAVPHLMRLQKLEVLRVCDTNLTEQGILQLASLPNLKAIYYRRRPGIPPSDDLRDGLRKRFPGLSISTS